MARSPGRLWHTIGPGLDHLSLFHHPDRGHQPRLGQEGLSCRGKRPGKYRKTVGCPVDRHRSGTQCWQVRRIALAGKPDPFGQAVPALTAAAFPVAPF